MVFIFLIQAAVILAAAQAFGRLVRRFGQPTVVGEIIAGLVLGPSLLGWLSPGVSAWLFPVETVSTLNILGQLGLVLFMFLVGLRLDPKELEEKRGKALLISFGSIALPFAGGYALAIYLHPRVCGPNVPVTSFALFMGVAMSITAFPVLARILRESGLLATRLGSVAIACAAVDDVSAWLILAAILGFVRAGAHEHLAFGQTLLLLVAYLALMLAMRPIWARLVRSKAETSPGTPKLVPILLFLLLSSSLTEWMGIHALFGAFFAGVVMPKDRRFIDTVGRIIEPLTATLILPLFFALTGLRTRIGTVFNGKYLYYTLLIILVAVAGKWLGAMISARFVCMSRRESNALGILMNTRGLVELVILNIGFELGLLPPAVFSMMVLMALTTTVMTEPLLRWVYPKRLYATGEQRQFDEISQQLSHADAV